MKSIILHSKDERRIERNKLLKLNNCNPFNDFENKFVSYIMGLYDLRWEEVTLNCDKVLHPFKIDMYIKTKKLGIEFDGRQHYSFTPRYHKTIEDFELQKRRDYMKEKLCLKKGIRLIRFRYNDLNIKTIRNKLDNYLGSNQKLFK